MSLFNEGCLNHYYIERLCYHMEEWAKMGIEYVRLNMDVDMARIEAAIGPLEELTE